MAIRTFATFEDAFARSRDLNQPLHVRVGPEFGTVYPSGTFRSKVLIDLGDIADDYRRPSRYREPQHDSLSNEERSPSLITGRRW